APVIIKIAFLVLEYCSNYKSAFFSLSSLAYIFHLHAFRTGPRAKQPRTVSLTNPPSSSSLPHHPPSLSSSTLSLSSLPNVTLETGMSVFVTGADFGVVRFIGTTQFAKGVWLGIELRKPNGKNDGSVKGHRYFRCKPSHGLFVKPEKATHRGINCSKILPSSCLENNS
ncbi:CAP-Gly domain-containing linker protein 4, partial [Geodia barretti]